MKPTAILLAALALSGCGTLNLNEALTNHVSCTLSGKVGLYSSMYGPLGVTSKINGDDAATICSAVEVAK